MGGSVVTHTCPLLIAEGYIISGIAVLDVVEGMFFSYLLPFLNRTMLFHIHN